MAENDGLTYGITAAGFYAPTYSECRSWLERKARAVFGKNLRTEPTTGAGRIINVGARALEVAFAGCEGVFNSLFFSTAVGVAVDKRLEAFAFERLDAVESTARLVVWGDDATAIPAGKQARVEDTLKVFATDALATIGLKVWVVEITATAGAGEIWEVEVSPDVWQYEEQLDDTTEDIARGLAAAIGSQPNYVATYLAETAAGDALVIDSTGPDLTVILTAPGSGAGAEFEGARVDATCTETGPVLGFAGTINVIATPVTGWVGVTNQLDAAVGRDVETDEQYKARWDLERFGPGKSTAKAMKAAFFATAELRELVFAVRVYESPGEFFTVTVYAPGLTDDEVAQIVWDNKPLGAVTKGPDLGYALDDEGGTKEINFERATALYVWMKIEITKGEGFPAIGDPATAIAKEIAVWGTGGASTQIPKLAYAGLKMGDDLVRFQVAQAINNAIAGVKNATIRIATTAAEGDPEPPDPSFLDADLVVADATFLVFDSSKVLVSVVA